MNNGYFIGVDLGGTKISGAVVDCRNNMVSMHTVPTLASSGEDGVMGRIICVLEKVIEKAKIDKKDVVSIGIGAPGPLNIKEGTIITTPNLPFKNFNIVKAVEEKFHIPVYLDNDGNVAALGEYTFGAGKNATNMIYVTVSTGIGGGAVLNGKLYRGSSNNALEIGHITLEKNGPRCNCGNYGCAEALASGTAIKKAAIYEVQRGAKTSLANYKDITAYEVFKEAEKGDAVAKSIRDNALNYLGILISNLINSFDPDVIVIGGGVSSAGDIVFNVVKEVVNNRCFNAMAENTKIVPSALKSNAGVMGAAALAMMESSH